MDVALAGTPVTSGTEGQNLVARATAVGATSVDLYEVRGSDNVRLGAMTDAGGGSWTYNLTSVAPGDADTGLRRFFVRTNASVDSATYDVTIPDEGYYSLQTSNWGYYATAADVATQPVVLCVLFQMTAVSAVDRSILNNKGTTISGWDMRVTSAERVQFVVANGAAANVTRLGPAGAIAAGTTIHAFMAQISGGNITVGFDRTTLLNTAIVGYTPAIAGTKFAVGANAQGGAPADDIKILGFIEGDTAWSQANFEAWCDSAKAAKDIVNAPVGNTIRKFRTKCQFGDLAARTVWTDDAGGASLIPASLLAGGFLRPVVTRATGLAWGW